jgi:hypothetical protein
MRKCSLTILLVLLVVALGLGAVACGSGGSGTSKQTPQQMLTASVTAAKAATSQTGTYQIDLTLNADSTQSTAGADAAAAALFAQPIKIKGSFAGQDDPARADLTVGVDFMGTTFSAGARALDDKAWLNVLGQWYETPADATPQAGSANAADAAKTLQDAIDEQDIDFNTWIKDLKAVGEETLADTKVTHLTGTLDVQKMVADLSALLQNPKLAELMATAGSTASSETGVTVPDAAGVQELQATFQQLVQGATIDLWVAKSDGSMRKIVLTAKVVIPAEMGLTGLSGADMVFTINLDAPNKAVEVKAPESAKPIADLQTDLMSNPLLSGLLGGLSGSGAGGLLGP